MAVSRWFRYITNSVHLTKSIYDCKLALQSKFKQRFNMPSRASLSVTDYSREKSSVGFEVVTLTAGNVAAQVTAIDNLRSAFAAICLGNIRSQLIAYKDDLLNNGVPTDPNAQREEKMLVVYEDITTHKLYRTEWPCVAKELSGTSLLQPGTDLYDLTVTEMAAFQTAFEAVVKAPNTGNSVQIVYAQYVGRNI